MLEYVFYNTWEQCHFDIPIKNLLSLDWNIFTCLYINICLLSIQIIKN